MITVEIGGFRQRVFLSLVCINIVLFILITLKIIGFIVSFCRLGCEINWTKTPRFRLYFQFIFT